MQTYILQDLVPLLSSCKVVVVDFFTPDCVPCKILSPVFEKIATNPEFKDVVFCTCNAEYEEISQCFDIKAVPTIMVFVEGVEAARHVGLTQQSTLENLVRNVLNK